jgi:hypothetical protein
MIPLMKQGRLEGREPVCMGKDASMPHEGWLPLRARGPQRGLHLRPRTYAVKAEPLTERGHAQWAPLKEWLMEQEEREYDEKLHEANERDDDVGYKEPREVADENMKEKDQ